MPEFEFYKEKTLNADKKVVLDRIENRSANLFVLCLKIIDESFVLICCLCRKFFVFFVLLSFVTNASKSRNLTLCVIKQKVGILKINKF